jgi:arylsulfatase A-like enzyme
MKTLSISLISLGLILGACSPGEGPKEEAKPNIVYILADDLGIGDLSCYGQKKFSTPNIDYLAENGMRFTRHYSGSTVCAPSRSVLMTGQHTGHTPVRGNKKTALPDASVTVAEVLKDAGYATGVFGKWSLGLLNDGIPDEGYPTNQGFEVFFGYDNQTLAHRYYPADLKSNESVVPLPGNDGVHTAVYAPDMIHDNLMRFIDDNRDRPFFLYYATIIPHTELLVPDDSLFHKFRGQYEEIPYAGNDYGADDFKWGGYCSQEYPNATYAAMVARLDMYVGRIIEKLETEGLLDNTIIFFTSDNGAVNAGGRDVEFFNSTANLRGMKRDLFEGGIRAPFIAYWPGRIVPGSQSDHISAFEDVLPTLADIAGSEAPEGVDGISFLPSLLGNFQEDRHEYLYWEYPEKGGKQAIRKENWKAVRVNVSEDPGSPIMLFDLEKDPYETTDISAEFPGIVDEMRLLMEQSRIPSADYPLFPGE